MGSRGRRMTVWARCVAVLVAATVLAAAAGGALLLDASGAVRRAAGGADVALVALCEVVLAGCVAWAWLATTAVVAEVLARSSYDAPASRRSRLVPVAWRRAVLLACGAAIAVGVTVPAQATPGSVHLDPHGRHAGSELAGLPMPDRPVGRVRADRGTPPVEHPTPTASTPTASTPANPGTHPLSGTVTVRAGDSLWSIAAHTLGPGAGDAAVSERWQAIYAASRDVLGDDPDLIRPGQHLTLPN